MSPLPQTLAEDYRARLAEPSHDEGGGNDIKDEMPYLLARAEGYQKVRVLEIGVRRGLSTSCWLAAAARVGGHVWSADKDAPDVPASWWQCGYWTFVRCLSQDLVPEELGWPPSYDVVFVDGDHELAGVLGDARRFVPYVAPGGVALFHDTKLRDPARPGDPPNVARALDIFCAERGLSWAERGGRFGLGVIEAPNG